MNIENIKRWRTGKSMPKTKNITIRVSKDVSEWLKEKNYSPTGIFEEALRDLKCPHV